MKIKFEVEMDTEVEQDLELIESIVQLINELKEQINYSEDDQ